MKNMPILEILAGLGMVQGMLLLLLVSLRYRQRENIPLALLLLVYSLRLGTIPTWNEAVMLANPWLLPLLTPLPFLFGPLLWCYIYSISDESGNKQPPRPFWHVLPYLLDLIFTTALLHVISPTEYETMIFATFHGAPPVHMMVRNGLKVLVNVVYVGLAVYRAFQKNPTAIITKSQRVRLKALAIVPVLSLVLFAFVALYPQASTRIASGSVEPFTILAASMTLLIYTISFLMFSAPEIPFICSSTSTENKEDKRVSEDERLLAEQVSRLLAAEIYRNPDLSLESMAQRLKTHPNRLSRAINCVFDESFPALIQRRRVRYFIEQAETGALDKGTILDLAFDAGFSSKSTFNRIFKQATGLSPSSYWDRNCRKRSEATKF